MACTNPLKAFTIGTNKKTGKAKLKITSRDCNYLMRLNGSWIKCYDPLPSEVSDSEDYIFSYDLIPCGSCYSCRMSRAKDWTVRCMLESQYHESSYFLTLTYDDNSLPFNIDTLSGEFSGKSSLVKSDLQKFIKRLRKNYPYDNHISYLACGEYGELSLRPHFHVLLFGLKLDDLKEYKKTELGYSLYNSEFISRLWPFGYSVIAPLTFESAAYVSRYTVKKAGDDKKDIYDEYLLEKEFIVCSLKPAIGYQYYVDHRDEIYKYDSIVLPEGKVVKPPRYFDKLYEIDFPDKMAVIKERRKKLSEINLDAQLDVCDYDFDKLLSVKDYYFKKKTSNLLRKEI